MPQELSEAKVLVIDDALEPEEIAPEALRTEAGFARYLEVKEEFKQNLKKIIDLKVNLILVDKNVNNEAEEILTDAGIIVLERVSRKDLKRASEHTGARIMKRLGLKTLEEIKIISAMLIEFTNDKMKTMEDCYGKGDPLLLFWWGLPLKK